MRDRALRWLLPLLLAVVLLGLATGPAMADEGPQAEPGPPDPARVEGAIVESDPDLVAEPVPGDAGVSAETLDAWLQESPAALWALLLLKYGVAAIGLVFLGLMLVRRDRVRAGILPSTTKVEPTVPFQLSSAVALLLLAFGLAMVLAAGLESLDLSESARLAAGMGVLQVGLLLGAAAVIWRRRQLQAGPQQSAGTTARAAFRTFAIATVFVLPATILSVAVLQAFDVPITLYGPIEKVVEGKDPLLPWVLLFFSVVAAPIAEESLFRGMLYPAIRKAVGPRYGVIVGMVATSLLFALIHWHAVSFLPLFTLAMVFAIVFERTNSLATVIGAHAFWNLATMLPLIIRGLA